MTDGPTLFLIPDLEFGGAQRFFVGVVNGIEDPRPIPVVFRQVSGLTDALRDDRPLHVLPGPTRSAPWYLKWFSGPVGLFRRTRGLVELVRLTGAVTVVSFRHRAHLVALLARLATRGRIAIVLSAHETLSASLQFEHGLVGRLCYESFGYRFFRQAHLVVAVADGVADDLAETFGVPRDRLSVLPKPVHAERILELGRLQPEAWPPTPPGAPVILGVGRLVRSKGFDVLVRALSRLAAHVNAHVVLVGEGPEASRLDALARSLGVADRLHRIGFTANPWTYMARADVLAVPSRTEGLPDVINEAHAIRIPVVASECSTSVADALAAGEAGVLVPPDDPAALADALTRTLEDGALAARLMERGHQRVATLSPEVAADRFAQMLETVIARHQGLPIHL